MVQKEDMKMWNGRVKRHEIRMLHWTLGLTLKDRKRNDDIRCIIGVACVMDKVRKARLRWCGHVL